MTTTYIIPISNGTDVYLSGPFPLPPQQWERLMIVLAAMKPALVGPETTKQATA